MSLEKQIKKTTELIEDQIPFLDEADNQILLNQLEIMKSLKEFQSEINRIPKRASGNLGPG